ncbi:hypothetical protein FHR28_001260 [Acinetobacter sp. BIGb0196]|nr:hypothetical protein [Acinetobacter guillouiae]MCW2252881.1 hypothetical protein [Acinetobacter sp. BIGb0204]NII36351.1 hypothetical protein [Acinetobacter sp. BIGb0196]
MPRSGLQCDATGTSIEVEVWDIPLANFAAIVAEPLEIGNLQLKDGRRAYIQSLNQTNTQFKGEKTGGVSV